MRRATNVSFDERPIEISLNSPFLVLIDPIVLDGMRAELEALTQPGPAEKAARLRSLPGSMRIGVHEINGFRAGVYRVGAADLEAPDDDDSGAGVCDVDSGAIVVADIEKLAELAKILTWERYDFALQSPLDDDSRFLALADELGGPFFGLLNSAEGTAFDGDGSYKLRVGALLRVSR